MVSHSGLKSQYRNPIKVSLRLAVGLVVSSLALGYSFRDSGLDPLMLLKREFPGSTNRTEHVGRQATHEIPPGIQRFMITPVIESRNGKKVCTPNLATPPEGVTMEKNLMMIVIRRALNRDCAESEEQTQISDDKTPTAAVPSTLNRMTPFSKAEAASRPPVPEKIPYGGRK